MARAQERHACATGEAPLAFRPTHDSSLSRLEKALRVAAELVIKNPIYAPIFRRLENDIELEKIKRATDVVRRARALLRQNEIG